MPPTRNDATDTNRDKRSYRRHAPYSSSRSNNSGPQTGPNSRKVYVGNLSWDVSWKELKDHFVSEGLDVRHADVLTNHDGRSKGCGIVELSSADEAKRAIETLNDSELMGRQMFVREDRQEAVGVDTMEEGNGNNNNDSNGTGGGGTKCFVGNLSWDVAWQDLKDHMRQAGEVVYVEVMTEGDGRSKGCGIVEFETEEEVDNAIETLDGTDLKGRPIYVREDREPNGGERKNFLSVYVGNLAYETSWQDLKDHMRQAGNVDQANILTGDDGRSKGCAIVLYQHPKEAQRAIRELQDSVLDGRPIFVREDREASGGSGCQLFVGNLSFDTSWQELKDHFRQCGDVERAEVIEGADGRKRGFGTIKFYKQKDASAAIRRLNGVELMGRRLEVRLDHKAN